MDNSRLTKHISHSYLNQRKGIAILALLFPVILWCGGFILGIELQESMSAYYHATVDGNSMRDVFVGILFAVGSFLYLYKGFSQGENISLNLAGICAVGVAVFPMAWECEAECDSLSIHGIFAFLLFISLAYVCLKHASDTLHLLKQPAQRDRYKLIYRCLGSGMLLSPIIAVLISFGLLDIKSYLFVVEAIAIGFFSSYWWVKSNEIRNSNMHFLE